MQVRSALSPIEYKEAAVLLRPKYFWLKFIGANWYATAICCICVYAVINALVKGIHLHIANVAILLLGPALIGFSWYRYTKTVSRAFEAQNANRTSVALEQDGVHVTGKTGAMVFVPWSSYTSWIEGKNVFLLKGDSGSLILPCDDISRRDVEALLAQKIT